MSRTPAEYEEEIARLKAEMEALRGQAQEQSAAALSLASLGARTGAPGSIVSLRGLEEMFVVVDTDLSVLHINTRMARWFGLEESGAARGRPLVEIDRGPLGLGAFEGLARGARATGQALLVEREVRTESGLPESYRIVVTPSNHRIELVVQDVTRLRKLETTFNRYVSPRVIEQMMMTPDADFLKVRKVELSVLFGDLRGFTKMSEPLSPEQTCEQVNEYLTAMVECVDRHDGTVDKFVGDETMALWGAPLGCDDHALRALLCAVEMQESQAKLVKKWANEGRPTPALGIGLNSGEAVVGNVGTPSRVDYTALGHTINLAARLCGGAEGGEILLTKRTYEFIHAQAKAHADRPIPRIRFVPGKPMTFKNVKDPVEVVVAWSASMSAQRKNA